MKNFIRVFSLLSLVASLQGVVAHAMPNNQLIERNFYEILKPKLTKAIPEAVKKQTGLEIRNLKITLETINNAASVKWIGYAIYYKVATVSFDLGLNRYTNCSVLPLGDEGSIHISQPEIEKATQFSLLGCQISVPNSILENTSF